MNYIEINKKLWNQRVDAHVDSEFYDNESFIKGRNSLNEIEMALLPDLNKKSVIHLQCHFGQDSISLARLGAEVTGVDFSDKAIEKAKELATQCNVTAEFIEHDVLTLSDNHHKQYDLVFSSYGTIGWHPDMSRWAKVVSSLLKPGGRMLLVEFHPQVWMYDQDFKSIKYSYFNQEAIIESHQESYTDNSQVDESMQEIGWNHSLSEVINALIKQNLKVVHFSEYDTSPYNCFNHSIPYGDGFAIQGLEGKLPLIFALMVEK